MKREPPRRQEKRRPQRRRDERIEQEDGKPGSREFAGLDQQIPSRLPVSLFVFLSALRL
jgi:hypothetical protein